MSTSSLSINLALSPPSVSASTPSCSYRYIPAVSAASVCRSRIRKPTGQNYVKSQALRCKGSERSKELRFLKVGFSSGTSFVAACTGNDMTIREYMEEEENPPALIESEMNSKPRRIALFVEPSPFSYVSAIAKDLEAARVTAANRIRLWNKGVDSESFHPRFYSNKMRLRLSNGEPDKPLIVHVGRLGVEKSLDFLKRVMDELPDAQIAFVGDGPFSLNALCCQKSGNTFSGKASKLSALPNCLG